MSPHPAQPPNRPSAEVRIAIVGGGVIGLSAALILSEAGAHATVYDAASIAGKGASDAAAGMLAPAYEAATGDGIHPGLFDLCHKSARAWRAFAKRLEQLADVDVGLGRAGALSCAVGSEQMSALQALANACADRGVDADILNASQARALEPTLSNNVSGALHLPTDTQVDNRAVLAALKIALDRRGVSVCTDAVIDRLDRRGAAWRTPDGRVYDVVVWTTGAGARRPVLINGADTHLAPDNLIVPVKGQLLSIAPHSDTPRRVLRFGRGYVAPKKDRIVIGATSHWNVDNRTIDADAVAELQAAAGQICPGLAAAPIQATWAGVRPGTADHAPFIGWSREPGVYLAAGHYRNGVLLAPETARIICADLLEGGAGAAARAFHPGRRETVSAAAAP